MTWLIYGATGYTGQLIARDAIALGMTPMLAARNESVAAIAQSLGCAHRVFSLGDRDLVKHLAGVSGVCHVAGPFTSTSAPMLDACLAAGVHYLDLATEIAVFEAAAARHDEAARRGVIVMPGAGFNVAVTDCVAVALKEALPEADRLTLAVDFGKTNHSYGGAVMGIEALASGAYVRDGDRILRVGYAARCRTIPLADGPRHMATLPFPFGDVVTARHSTGIPNIEIYLPIDRASAAVYRAASVLRRPLSTGVAQRALKRVARWAYRTPDDAAARARVRTTVWGEASAPNGRSARVELTTPHSYEVTSEVAARAMQAIARSPGPAGFRTPGPLLGGLAFLATLREVSIGAITTSEPASEPSA